MPDLTSEFIGAANLNAIAALQKENEELNMQIRSLTDENNHLINKNRKLQSIIDHYQCIIETMSDLV